MNKFEISELSNGVKVITVPKKDSETVSVNIYVATGSDYEKKSENGLSHFLEHMFFKGTKRRTSKDLREEIRDIGARHNAYTSSFLTSYYINSHIKFFDKILDILSDAFINSTFPEDEINKEKGVILSEIDRFNDNPEALSYYNLIKVLYGDQPQGRKVIGTKENIKNFNRSDFINYRDKHYHGNQTIISVSGDLDHKKVVKKIKDFFAKASDKKKETLPSKVKIQQSKPRISVFEKKTEQSHIQLGCRTFNRFDKRRPVLEVMNVILGGTAASRLFSTIREEMGLAYAVNSYPILGYDYGTLNVYMGVDHKKVENALSALIEELKLLRDKGVTSKELKKIKVLSLGISGLKI